MSGFFLTPASEKTKTQAQGGTFLILRETQEKKLNFTYISLHTEKISWCTTFYAIFVNKYFQLLPI